MPLSDGLGLHTSACMETIHHVHLKYLKVVYEFKYAIVGHSIENTYQRPILAEVTKNQCLQQECSEQQSVLVSQNYTLIEY